MKWNVDDVSMSSENTGWLEMFQGLKPEIVGISCMLTVSLGPCLFPIPSTPFTWFLLGFEVTGIFLVLQVVECQ